MNSLKTAILFSGVFLLISLLTIFICNKYDGIECYNLATLYIIGLVSGVILTGAMYHWMNYSDKNKIK